MSCLFCKIINREIPAQIVAETDTVMAIHDINPQAPVHILVLPKEHCESALKMTHAQTALMADLIQLAQQIAQQLDITESTRLVMNNGAAVGQSVFHLHMHLLSGRIFQWPPG